jgi:ADP-ribose pyrophosphatase
MKKTLFEGEFIRLVDDDGWEFADRVTGTGVVGIIAIDGEHVLLVEEFRRAVQAKVISLPAGLIDRAEGGHAQETAIEAALRELREETGYTARSIEEVASGPISAGMTTERVTFFLAHDLKLGQQMLDGDEDIKVHRVPLHRLSAFFSECQARGAEIDPKIFVGLYFVKMHGLAPGPLPWLRKLRARVAAKQGGGIAYATASAMEMQSRHRLQNADERKDSVDRSANASDALARLGKVLNWLGLTIGLLCGVWVLVCIATLFGAFGYTDAFATTALLIAGVVVGFFAWLAGRAALYVFAGR